MNVPNLNAIEELLKKQKTNPLLAALKQKETKKGTRKVNKNNKATNFNWPNLPTQKAGTRRRKHKKQKKTRKY